MSKVKPFDQWAEDYDHWYDQFPFVYQSELNLIRRLLPQKGRGLEVGVGSGRFAGPLGVTLGLDPARRMLSLAHKRGVMGIQGEAECLPFLNEQFDFLLMVTTLCFLSDAVLFLQEAKRVLKKGGFLVIGYIDRESFLGEIYLARKKKSRFFREARLFSSPEVMTLMAQAGWGKVEFYQTIFHSPEAIVEVEEIKPGWGKGGFVAVRVQK